MENGVLCQLKIKAHGHEEREMSEEIATVNYDFANLIDKQRIADMVAEKLNQDIANSVYYNVQEIVKKEVLELLEPEIKLIVQQQKDAVIKSIEDAMPAVGTVLCETMSAIAIKNLNGYGGNEIMRKIFG